MLLAQPGAIGTMRLRNRIVMGPMGTNYGTSDGLSTERDAFYYAERARGGAALIVTEAINASARGRNHHRSLCAFHDKFIPGLARLARAIQDNGALAVGQLNHRGALLRRAVLGMEPVGPSPWTNPNTGEPVRELRVDELAEIRREFRDAAVRLWRAGFDGVELHAANGYLFQQFLSPRINRRADAYGGSLENRMRLLVETVDEIRGAIPDAPLVVRLSATEYVADGYPTSDAVAVAAALERAGVSAIDLSGGTNESPELSRFCIQPPSMPRRCLEPYAAPFKEALSIPLILAGRIIDAADAEAILQAKSADFVSIGRGMLADAYWARKALGELPTPIRACISCNVCIERLTREQDVACVQNPLVGTEQEGLSHAEPQAAGFVPGSAPKRVLVIGAGVAGVEAARVAAGRGHRVEIWESAPEPGGQMRLATAAPHKEEVEAVWSYRWEQVRALSIPVRTKTRASVELLRAFAPDVAVVATGGRPRLPRVLSEVPEARSAWDILDDPQSVPRGARVTIVGGGMVGAETAELLAQRRGCKVLILEMAASIAADMPRNNRVDIMLRLRELGVEWRTDTRIDGPSDLPAGDVLVCATGVEPNRDVVPLLEEAGIPYVLIGDCNVPGDFMTVLRDAWLTALSIDYVSVRQHVAS